MRHAAEPVAKDVQCRTAQSYPKLQNTRERKNTKRPSLHSKICCLTIDRFPFKGPSSHLRAPHCVLRSALSETKCRKNSIELFDRTLTKIRQFWNVTFNACQLLAQFHENAAIASMSNLSRKSFEKATYPSMVLNKSQNPLFHCDNSWGCFPTLPRQDLGSLRSLRRSKSRRGRGGGGAEGEEAFEGFEGEDEGFEAPSKPSKASKPSRARTKGPSKA